MTNKNNVVDLCQITHPCRSLMIKKISEVLEHIKILRQHSEEIFGAELSDSHLQIMDTNMRQLLHEIIREML